MMETGEGLRLILVAIGLGVAIPVLVQLFLTLRELQRTAKVLNTQVEPTLRAINDLTQRLRDTPPAGQQSTAIVAALIPAAIAAYRAYRDHHGVEKADSEATATPTNTGGKS